MSMVYGKTGIVASNKWAKNIRRTVNDMRIIISCPPNASESLDKEDYMLEYHGNI